MKKLIVVTLFCCMVLYGCNVGVKANGAVISEEEKLENLQGYLAEGVVLDTQRPYPGVLSEQEVLMKAADYAVKEGVLHPDYYLYEIEPALMTAQIETPVLVHSPQGEPIGYKLTAVDKTGVDLMDAHVKYRTGVSDEDFVSTLYEPIPNRAASTNEHLITKREVKEFVKKKFPDQQVSEPMAITGLQLEGKPHSSMLTFWYFRTEEVNARSVSTVIDEYLIDMSVSGYKPLEANSNRAVISNAYEGNRSPRLGGFRMIKLTTPLYPTFKTDLVMRGIHDTGPRVPVEPLQFTGVPLE